MVRFFLALWKFYIGQTGLPWLSAPAMLSENICVQWRAMSLSSRSGSSEPGRTFSNMHDHSRKLTASCQPYWNAPISNAQPDSRPRLLSKILNVNGIARDLDGKWMISSILFPFLLLVESFPFILLVFHLSTQGQKMLCSLLCSFTPRLWPQLWEFAAMGSVETVVKPIESQQKKGVALSFALQSHSKCLSIWPNQIFKERESGWHWDATQFPKPSELLHRQLPSKAAS